MSFEDEMRKIIYGDHLPEFENFAGVSEDQFKAILAAHRAAVVEELEIIYNRVDHDVTAGEFVEDRISHYRLETDTKEE